MSYHELQLQLLRRAWKLGDAEEKFAIEVTVRELQKNDLRQSATIQTRIAAHLKKLPTPLRAGGKPL